MVGRLTINSSGIFEIQKKKKIPMMVNIYILLPFAVLRQLDS